tara:strand:- start:344 stop:811 length:468 start_codon:yes stop_codon:yes gene_type:complete
MGTRSLTYIEESFAVAAEKYICTTDDEKNNNEVHEEKQNILCMYRQYDGYLSGHGAELAEFLHGFNIVNGIRLGTPKRTANGMGCLAAQLIAHFKDGIGNIYIHNPNDKDCGEEYTYTIYEEGGKVCIRAYDVWAEKIIFDGSPEEMLALAKAQV